MEITPLHEWHVANNGRMVDFAGWEMPIQYSSITDEHQAVRNAAGLFDISHMGRLIFTGPQAEQFLDHLITNNVATMKVGQVRYALVCNEQGGVKDDVLVYRFDDFHMLVVNASNRKKIIEWIEAHRGDFDVTIEDMTMTKAMLAVQGPKAANIVNQLCESDVSDMGYYRCGTNRVLDQDVLVSRTGYTGEDGFEIIIAANDAPRLWKTILETGADANIQSCGLGCRDTLRLEAGMPLYGHELEEEIDPLTADLKFAVKLKKSNFLGKESLQKVEDTGPTKFRIGLEIEGRRIAREHSPVQNENGETVGEVTSGTFSPTLEKVIAMAFVGPHKPEVGDHLNIDLRGKPAAATVVPIPFYKRTDS